VDNVSHALAGLLLAECAIEASAARSRTVSPRFRALALFGSALANNFPDFDFVYAGITGAPLGYLLHHRGHTHTVPVALALGALTLGIVWLIGRRSLLPAEIPWLAALCLAGPLVHISMDFTNSYGVHPFWPVDDGWFYGDGIFIVEPLFFATVLPTLAFAARSWSWRIGYALVLAMVLIAAIVLPFISTGSAAAIFAVVVAVSIAAALSRPRARLVIGVTASWAVAGTFFAASLRAKSLARTASPAGDEIHDVVATPMPANPLCFDTWTLVTRQGSYIARRAMIAPLAGFVPAARCITDAGAEPTAPLHDVRVPSTPDIRWLGEFAAPTSELSALAERDCRAAAFLRFARAPYWTRRDGSTIVGDLRYDRHPGLDFADILVTGSSPCPAATPPWTPPRRELLSPSPR
jgi:inner membrane protein